MTTTELRTIALAIKQRIETMQNDLAPALAAAQEWVLDDVDTALPSIASVKAVYQAFDAFDKPGINLYDEIRILKATTDAAAELPETSGVVTWEAITDKPETFPPVEHTHAAAAVAWNDVTNKPSAFACMLATVMYTGNGTAARTLSFTGDFIARAASCFCAGDSNTYIIFISNDMTSIFNSVTISRSHLNLAGCQYQMILWG